MLCKSFKTCFVFAIVASLTSNATAQLDQANNFIGACTNLIKLTPASELAYESTTGKLASGIILSNGLSEHFPRRDNAFETDTAHYAFIDTNYFNFKWWPSFVGGDLFLTGDFYTLHLSGPSSLMVAGGIGAELRVKPLFVGYEVSLSECDGLSGLPLGPFASFSFYGGAMVGQYKIDCGQLYANNYDSKFRAEFTCDFFGVSRKYGEMWFVEPGIKLMFPTVSHYPVWRYNDPWPYPTTKYFHIYDLFVSLSVRVGIGGN